MPSLAAGVVRFQKEIYPSKRALFEKLAIEQKPQALFITCSDSRVDPNMVTQSEPGQLFICRDVGNIVPPHTNHNGSMTASIEFAVGALNVPNIVVCGHTECGAMKGALDPDSLAELPHVAEWMSYARAAVQTVREMGRDLSDEARMQMLIEQNVLLQLRHLATHPYVAARLAAGRVKLHGWIYDIRTGAVTAWDKKEKAFIDVERHYAEEVALYEATQHLAQHDDHT